MKAIRVKSEKYDFEVCIPMHLPMYEVLNDLRENGLSTKEYKEFVRLYATDEYEIIDLML